MNRAFKVWLSRMMGFHASSEGRLNCICFRSASGLFDQAFSTWAFRNASWTAAALCRLSPAPRKPSTLVSDLPVKPSPDEWSSTPERTQTEDYSNAPRALWLLPAIRPWSSHFLQFLEFNRQKRRWRLFEKQIRTDSPGKAVPGRGRHRQGE